MTIYSCGHKALQNSDGEYLNGSHALWNCYVCDADGEHSVKFYGVLCDECIILYNAVKCKLGGIE